MKEVVVNQGLPGSGKSYASKKMLESLPPWASWSICSADDTHMENGVYNFKPENIGKAHGNCLKKFVNSLKADANLIIVDNTNITNIEIAPYAALAQAYEYGLSIVRFDCSVETSVKRNSHRVPEEVIKRMAASMETPIARWGELEVRKTD